MTKKLAGTPSRRKVSRIDAAPRLSAPPSKVNATTLAEVGRTLTTDAGRLAGVDVAGFAVAVVDVDGFGAEVVGLTGVGVDGTDADGGCVEVVLVGGQMVLVSAAVDDGAAVGGGTAVDDGTAVGDGRHGCSVAVAAVGPVVDDGVPGPVVQPATSATNAPTSASLARIVLASFRLGPSL